VVLAVVYVITRLVFAVVTVAARYEVSKDAGLLVLGHGNAVLRRQVKRVWYEPADRIWLSALACLLPRRRWAQVFGVTPETLLRWHRRLVTGRWIYPRSVALGRLSTSVSVTRLVVAMARQDHGWGIAAFRVNWPGSVTRSRVRLCGRSSRRPGLIPRHSAVARPGVGSCLPRLTGSSLVISCV
jgi:hypothetical protein